MFNLEKTKVLTKYVTQSILDEAVSWPSLGLVSIQDTGSHNDMDIYTFIKSSLTLESFFSEALTTTFNHAEDKNYDEIFLKIKDIGIKAEKSMYKVTNGINTHKGSIFLGLILISGAAISLIETGSITPQNVCNSAYKISNGFLISEVQKIKNTIYSPKTTGEFFIQNLNLLGIRGEVINRFSSILNYGLPTFTDSFKKGTYREAIIQTLITFMSLIHDTTLLNRNHNLEILKEVQNKSKVALQHGGIYTNSGKRLIKELENYLRRNNLSPGGSADLVSMTLVLKMWSEIKIESIITSNQIKKRFICS